MIGDSSALVVKGRGCGFDYPLADPFSAVPENSCFLYILSLFPNNEDNILHTLIIFSKCGLTNQIRWKIRLIM